MRIARGVPVVVVALAVIASVAGCSTASDPVPSVLWNQVTDAEAAVYRAVTGPEVSAADAQQLSERLTAAAVHWDGGRAPAFSADEGTSVFYDLQKRADGDVSFALFVASGVDGHHPAPGWTDSRPSRVYTCYRVAVSFRDGIASGIHQTHDQGEDQLSCPSELVDALGDSAQYREPVVFDG